uniref:Uncharacterized protein n=1 Tax=Leersia perrieri TaxID=77586 RepID=A0A0D9VNH9_9ORYZ
MAAAANEAVTVEEARRLIADRVDGKPRSRLYVGGFEKQYYTRAGPQGGGVRYDYDSVDGRPRKPTFIRRVRNWIQSLHYHCESGLCLPYLR